MNKIIFAILLLTSPSAFSQSAKYDGYIVKFKDNMSSLLNNEIEKSSELKNLNLSFGSFYKITSNNLIP